MSRVVSVSGTALTSISDSPLPYGQRSMPTLNGRNAKRGRSQAKIVRRHVCSLFARLPRYQLSAPGTNRQGFELKSAQTGTDRR
jgi:hypothetical protein